MAKGQLMNEDTPESGPKKNLGIHIDSVSKGFATPDGTHTSVFENLSISFEPNQLHVVMGTSGCGKSTLGYLLAGFTTPDSGSVTLDNEPVKAPSPERLLVFQETALWPWMTVLENVIFGPKVRGEAATKTLKTTANELLAKFGLAEFSDRYPDQLSGEILQEYYLALFEETRQTTVFITSELEEALFLADKIYIMGGQPTRIVDIIDVDLPRPRNFEVTVSKEYLAYKEKAIHRLFQS